jgi:hypothetical protein
MQRNRIVMLTKQKRRANRARWAGGRKRGGRERERERERGAGGSYQHQLEEGPSSCFL